MRTSFGRIGLHGRAVVAAAALYAAVSMVSCGGCGRGCIKKPEKVVRVPLNLPVPESEFDVVDNFIKAFNHGDLAEAAAMFTVSATWKEVGGQLSPVERNEDIRATFESIKRAMSDARIMPRLFLRDGDWFIVNYALIGTHDGWLAGTRGEGKTLGAEGLAFFHVEGGKVLEVENYFNPSTLLAQAEIVDGPSEPVPIPPSGSKTIEHGLDAHKDWGDVVRTAYDALDTGSAELFEKILSLDVVYMDHVAGRVVEGPSKVAAALSGYDGAFGDVKLEEMIVRQVEKYVVARFSWNGRFEVGDGRPWAIGKKAGTRRADLFLVEDGRITEIQSFGRPDELFFQLDFNRP